MGEVSVTTREEEPEACYELRRSSVSSSTGATAEDGPVTRSRAWKEEGERKTRSVFCIL